MLKKLNCAHGTVHNYLKKYGLNNRTPAESKSLKSNNYTLWSRRKEKQAKKLLESGVPQKEVANSVETTENTISDYNIKKWHIDCTANITKFGKPTEYNGIVYRSASEAEIARFLDEQNIKFEHERKLNYNNYTCDFYLLDFDIWMEYDGLEQSRPVSYFDGHEKIISYKNQKLKYCVVNASNWKKIIIVITHLYQKDCKLRTKYSVRPIERNEADNILDRYHYLGKAPLGSQQFYGLFAQNILLGCCVLGKGANKHLSSGVGGPALELTRLCTEPWLPRNSLSIFLSQIPSWIIKERPDIEYLVSFADANEGHTGSIYKAVNWQYTGQGKPDYKYLLTNGSTVHKSRFRCRDGKTEKQLAKETESIKVPQEGKHRFIYNLLGNL